MLCETHSTVPPLAYNTCVKVHAHLLDIAQYQLVIVNSRGSTEVGYNSLCCVIV
jgi:hypothetical protein